MEIRVGIQHVNREIVLESNKTAEEIIEAASRATNGGTELRLEDSTGRVVLIPGANIGYVEVGAEQIRRVGFAH
ncbi:DUF3107 domain-containing protein [Neomicrococcus aestuarii]|jgi:hypothetical protein|uniref:ATP-binding protein n=1 Tax=Neomicrococcus aestuarii TaxID=556325 RepID=A0A1L2ZKD4_9MICC|nr:DUF3107 domain-containing protein [Neomicrococcus aestuarii]APF39669.1 ATP-binding protein [Neomicrococcus aestuarii]MBB5513682.1 hypothetical protein [Neomicrococcus aestuarii]